MEDSKQTAAKTAWIEKNVVEFQVSARNALFTDILTRTSGEKLSYCVPTYEAIKGIMQSIYWKPTIIWKILDVRVMKPIYFEKKNVKYMDYNSSTPDLAHCTYLHDVCYQVRAAFEWNMNRPEMEKDRKAAKHLTIAKTWIEKGGRRDIFMGTRECQGYVEPCVFGEGESVYDHTGVIPLGLMEHGFTYPDEVFCEEDRNMITLRLWNAVMENGIIHFPQPEECDRSLMRSIRPAKMKKFGVKTEKEEETA